MKKLIVLLALSACTPNQCGNIAGDDTTTNTEYLANPTKRPVLANSTRPPIIPSSWTQSAWFIDPVSGNDNNTCITTGSSCKTYAEVAARWGTYSPRLQQATTITFKTSMSDNTDPVYFNPYVERGVQVTITGPIDGTTQVGGTVTLASVTPKTRATPQLLQADLGVNGALDLFVANTSVGDGAPSHVSNAWVYKLVSGTIFSLSEPLTTAASPVAAPTSNDSWTNGDLVNLYAPVKVNLVEIMPVMANGQGGTVTNAVLVQNITIYDPNASLKDLVTVGSSVTFSEVTTQRAFMPDGWGSNLTYVERMNNVDFQGTIAGNKPAASSTNFGVYSGGIARTTSAIVGGAIGLDMIFNSVAVLDGTVGINGGLYIASTNTIVNSGYINAQATGLGDGIFWGPGGLIIKGTAKVVYTNTHATLQFLQTGAWSINASASATPVCAGLPVTQTTITAAKLDAACVAATGFGGFAWGQSGAWVTAAQ